jgi:predicted HicB family RNase H-like nuclease
MNTLKYKDFMGSVQFSDVDNLFFGKIEGINGLVNFEGETVQELRKSFEEAVEDYLDMCKNEGIEIFKSYTGVLNVRIPPEIHKKTAILAATERTTINNIIKNAIEKEVNSTMG